MGKIEDGKMLTPSDKDNIKKFERLGANHKRVFKHRLRVKCISAIRDIQFVLSHYEKLRLKPDKFIDIIELTELLEQYESLCLLQNM